MHQDSAPPPQPPRYDMLLAAGAIVGYGGTAAFTITQLFPALRVGGDARYALIMWFLAASGPATMCWFLRPRLIHLAYAMKLGRALAVLPESPHVAPRRRALATRQWIWRGAGSLGTAVMALSAAADTTSVTGLLNLRGANLDIVTLLLCQIGCVCAVIRILGPELAAVDDLYDLARHHGGGDGGSILDFRRPTG